MLASSEINEGWARRLVASIYDRKLRHIGVPGGLLLSPISPCVSARVLHLQSTMIKKVGQRCPAAGRRAVYVGEWYSTVHRATVPARPAGASLRRPRRPRE